MISEVKPDEYSVAARIHALAQAAYALEAERIGCAQFPPLRESLEDLRRSSDSFLVFEESGSIVGALSFDRSTDPISITRLVVSPAHLRQGIATGLLCALEQRLSRGARLSVSTAQANIPAVFLYHQLGYVTAGISDTPEGIPLLRLFKSK